MSVPNQTPYVIYTANGVTTVFPFEFYIISAADLQITVNGVDVNTGYTVTGTGNLGGGNVTFLTPPATGATVMLERVVPTTRLTDYQDNGDMLSDTVNKDFDRLWMAIQRSFIQIGLVLRRPLTGLPFNAEGYRISRLGSPLDSQDVATRAGKLLSFDALGALIAALPPTGSAADVLTKLAKSDGATKMGSQRADGKSETVQ
ncbi:phage tail fiber protein [Sodalis glossinidius]|uniref:phage tail fiber domain-containing protein n=1 Tax=Sodalis glossinidius TaxID=63612 RepID=UPI000317372C|nr:phage tail fiber protein [Sodalis glossinidius]